MRHLLIPQTQNICITFIQRRLNVFGVGGQHCIDVMQMFCVGWEMNFSIIRRLSLSDVSVIVVTACCF